MDDERRSDRPKPEMPRMIPGRMGTRNYSIGALVERVVENFHAEYAGHPALREADTAAKRMQLVAGCARYVFAVESVHLTAEQQAEIIERAYSDLFGYGPLDRLFLDERITTIALRGAGYAAVRYGHGELGSIGPLFDDEVQLQEMLKRMLFDAGVDPQVELPSVETGLAIGGRRVSLSIMRPPVTPFWSADIRVHPQARVSFTTLMEMGFMTSEAAALLEQIARSRYGFIIVGEPETGKTTLLNALCPLVVDVDTVSVERSSELELPEGTRRLTPEWPTVDRAGVSFGERIEEALELAPHTLILDEMRADEPQIAAPLLDREPAPRQIWTMRGVPDAKRLQSALGMLARRAAPSQGERLVHALYERLPFVVSVARIRERLQLFSIAEWQSRVDSDYPDYVMIMRYDNGAARRTDQALARWLD